MKAYTEQTFRVVLGVQETVPADSRSKVKHIHFRFDCPICGKQSGSICVEKFPHGVPELIPVECSDTQELFLVRPVLG